MSIDTDISVVIPCYNAADFIRGALESIFRQTLLTREVIVVDDVSKDNTVEIVEEIAAQAPLPVRLLRMKQNSGGPPGPINNGIREAKGELIAILEQDDTMLPERLEKERECFRGCPSLGLAFCRCMCVKGEETEESEDIRTMVNGVTIEPLAGDCCRISQRSAYEALVDGMFALTCSTFFFPRTVWERCGGFDEEIPTCCDYGFMQKVATRGDMGFVDMPLVNWRMCGGSLYRSVRRNARYADLAFVLRRFDPVRLGKTARSRLRGRVRDEGLGAAYFARQSGDYTEALRLYLWSMRKGQVTAEALRGLAGLAFRRLIGHARR